MKEEKIYEYTGFLVLKKRKKSGVLKISDGKIAFYQGNTSLMEWNQTLMKDVIQKCLEVPIRKIIFAKPEICLSLMYKNSSIVFVNEMHSYEDIMDRISEIKTIQTDKMSEETKIYDECYSVLNTFESLNNQVKKCITSDMEMQQNIPNILRQIKSEILRNTLSSISIEQINANKEGIRVSLLKDAGITNIQVLCDRIDHHGLNIWGIGEQSIPVIVNNAKSIREKAEKNIKIRISKEDSSVGYIQLVSVLYTLIKEKDILNQLREVNNVVLIQLQNNYLSTAPMLNLESWYWSDSAIKNNIISKKNDCLKFQETEQYEKTIKNCQIYEAIKKDANKNCWQDFESNTAPYYALLEKYLGSEAISNINDIGLPIDLYNSIKEYKISDENMKSTLRKYQIFGTQYILHQKNVLLGDEMGLGKTVEAIAAISHLKSEGKLQFLIVCPLSVLVNWCREITNHSYLEPICIYGKSWREGYLQWLDGKGIGVTTYETVNRFDFQSLNKIDMLVVDEAHYIKNPNAQRTKNLLKVASIAQNRLFMTGTPLENKVDEMCFLISCLQPLIARQIAQNKELIGADQFKEKIAPVYLRRIRKDVLGELPDLIESKEWGSMNEEEEDAYRNSVINESFMGMRRVSWNVDNINNSTKNKRLREICEDAKNEGRKVVIFSYFRDVLEKIKECLQDDALEIINGSIPVQKRQQILDEFNVSDPGTVLISQIQAGGTGLNMQCASVVVLCEPQYKPSIENQAISRVYRMGQARNVEVHRLLIENSVDERLMDLINSKQQIFDSYADESVVAKTDEEYNKAITNIIAEEKVRLGITA